MTAGFLARAAMTSLAAALGISNTLAHRCWVISVMPVCVDVWMAGFCRGEKERTKMLGTAVFASLAVCSNCDPRANYRRG